MLVVVRNKIVQREAVVRRDEVDARVRATTVVLIQVRRPREAVRELAQRLFAAAPVVAEGVAILPVPLRPLRREVADLVPTLADVPRLGDELHGTDDRVLLDEIEEG